MSHENLDRMVLSEFYNAVEGAHWKANKNWNSGLPLRVWKGVNVDNIETDDARVTRLDLDSNGLDGNSFCIAFEIVGGCCLI